MTDTAVYKDIAERTGGNIYIGVVGPVRTGKSSFIKKFMETLVIPNMDDIYMKERARDELPQSGSGRTIMTAEPKFVPEEAAQVELAEGMQCSVRLVDCVGYMVSGAFGNIENGGERMVMTPWYDTEIPMSQAAEEGTRRVIRDHSTVGILVTTDGSVCGIPREEYVLPEMRIAEELHAIGKPFVTLLNCAEPASEAAMELAMELSEKYGCACLPVNCLELGEEEIKKIIYEALCCFPVTKFNITIPEWLEALCEDNSLKKKIYDAILESCSIAATVSDFDAISQKLNDFEQFCLVLNSEISLGKGEIGMNIAVPKKLYYETVSAESGFEIKNDRDLMSILCSISGIKEEYERVHEALENARKTGYGIVMPTAEEMTLEEPQIVRQGSRYGVKLKASAPSIHMIMANIETEVSPAIGGEKASEDVINFLLQGYDGDMSRIWESNIFGKSLNDIAGEGLASKIKALPDDARGKLQNTIQRIINEGSGGLICIIL